MKYLHLLVIFLFSLDVHAKNVHFLLTSEVSDGGVVIGDGGVAIRCNDKNKYQLFDLLEDEVLNGKRPVTLQANGTSLSSMLTVGLERVKAHYNLTQVEFDRLRQLSFDFINNPVDLWEIFELRRQALVHMNSELLNINNIKTERRMLEAIRIHNCKAKVVAINTTANQKTSLKNKYKNVCWSVGAEENCLLLNTRIFSKFNNEHAACLVIHEFLRLLPEDKKPNTEFELRQHVAKICTQ